MALNKKKCKVCGKEYRACNPIGLDTGKFRWQAFTCSPECGSVFLERLIASQSKITEPKHVIEEESVIVDLYTPESDDDYDIWYDEDESDDEE